MSAPRSLETNLLFLAGELTHILHRKLTVAFRKNRLPVTVEQFAVLTVLFYENGINQQEVGVRLDRDKTTITRVVSNMERARMIARKTDKRDARGKLIFLTVKGKALQQRAIRLSGALYMQAVEGMKASELNSSTVVLARAIRNFK